MVSEARTVVLHRARRGFGFILRGAKASSPLMQLKPSPRCPALQYLDDVDPGGVADIAGLNPGDFLLTVNISLFFLCIVSNYPFPVDQRGKCDMRLPRTRGGADPRIRISSVHDRGDATSGRFLRKRRLHQQSQQYARNYCAKWRTSVRHAAASHERPW